VCGVIVHRWLNYEEYKNKRIKKEILDAAIKDASEAIKVVVNFIKNAWW